MGTIPVDSFRALYTSTCSSCPVSDLHFEFYDSNGDRISTTDPSNMMQPPIDTEGKLDMTTFQSAFTTSSNCASTFTGSSKPPNLNIEIFVCATQAKKADYVLFSTALYTMAPATIQIEIENKAFWKASEETDCKAKCPFTFSLSTSAFGVTVGQKNAGAWVVNIPNIKIFNEKLTLTKTFTSAASSACEGIANSTERVTTIIVEVAGCWLPTFHPSVASG